MKITKQHIDTIIDRILDARKDYLLEGKGDNGRVLITGIIVMSYDGSVTNGVARHIHKRLLEFMEVQEYWNITKKIATEITEYNENKGA